MRRGYHVSVRLLVVGHRFYAEYLAQLVHQLPLLPVHGREGVASRPLLALLGQLDEIAQRFVYALGQHRVPLGETLHELGVLGQGLLLGLWISR